MRSIGFQNFQQCCFRLPDWWSNSMHWMGQLFLAIYFNYKDVIMSPMAPQITSLTFVYSTVYSGADQRKHQSSASLAFVGEFPDDRWIPPQRASNAWKRSIVVQHNYCRVHLHVFNSGSHCILCLSLIGFTIMYVGQSYFNKGNLPIRKQDPNHSLDVYIVRV